MPNTISSDEMRERFSQAISAMYQEEVPQYGDLLDLVADVNLAVLESQPELCQQLENADELARLNVERHGAVRVGKAEELATLKHIFQIMGMYPVGYYDLSRAGLPAHATAFRPTSERALARNPFRLFTSLLRLELIEDPQLREKAGAILARRDIFTPGCRTLLATYDRQGYFTPRQGGEFISEVVETFRWHQQSAVDIETYRALYDEHRLIADVVCFPHCHVNHLTLRTLDIDRVQAKMSEYGMAPKAIIEGPPRRSVPILLRQTRFKAQKEPVLFIDKQAATHLARYGEAEQRGIALTPRGRALYNTLLREAGQGVDNFHHQQHLCQVFSRFPDNSMALRQQALAYFRYRLTPLGERHRQEITPADCPEILIARGWLIAQPIIYEDFLPVSAAGIFHADTDSGLPQRQHRAGRRQEFELALGGPVMDEFRLYQEAEQKSKRRCGLLI